MTELGLLHELWERGALTLWRGGDRYRSLTAARAMLLEGGERILWGGPLAERLVVVVPGGGALRREAEAAVSAAVVEAALAARERVVVVGLLSRLEPARFGDAWLVRLTQGGADYRLTLLAAPDLVASWARRWPAVTRPPGPETRLVGLFVCTPRRPRAGAMRRSLACVGGAFMTTTRALIPVESGHEARLARYLVATGRSFAKPLRFDVGADLVLPDFVLHDVAGRAAVPLEVFGRTDEAYARRRAEKATYYREVYGADGWWCWTAASADPAEVEPFEAAVARLPPRDGGAARAGSAVWPGDDGRDRWSRLRHG